MIFIATDHNGFEIKKQIIEYFKNAGIVFIDIGPFELDPADDYPPFAFELCDNVLQSPENKGILICGTGGGMCIAANKVKGIRAAEAESPAEAILIRHHNDSNVLVLSKMDYNPGEVDLIIEAWLNTPFSNEERHVRRLKQISDYENNIKPVISTPISESPIIQEPATQNADPSGTPNQ